MPTEETAARRLDPEIVVGLAKPDSRLLFWFLRCGVAVVVGLVALLASLNVLGAWAVTVAVPVALLIAWRSNGRRLLDLWSELTRSGWSTHSMRPGLHTEELAAYRVAAGDYICRAAEYEQRLKLHRMLEAADATMSERRAQTRYNNVNNLYDLVRQVGGPDLGEKKRPVWRTWTSPRARPLPKASLTMVVAVRPADAAERLQVALGSGAMPRLDAGETVLRWGKAPGRRPVHGGSPALLALLHALPRDGKPVDEPGVVDPAVRTAGTLMTRRALRAAIIAGLVQRHRGLRGWLGDLRRAWWSGSSDNWIGFGRTLRLTTTGEVWLHTHEAERAGRTRPEPEPRSEFRYDVCLSFASEQRPYVERVATGLRQVGVRVFYDNDEQVDLWGTNLFDRLTEVYSHESRFCLMFISAEYKTKEWTNLERKSAQDRTLRERGREYILPVRFDDTVIPGLLSTIKYVHVRDTTPEQLTDLVRRKLRDRR